MRAVRASVRPLAPRGRAWRWRGTTTAPPAPPNKSFLEVPMSQPLPGFPTNTSGLFRASPPTQVMTMANGVRVAAEDNNDSTTCVGLGIDVGARLETKEEQGMSALLKRMLLTGRFSQQLERLGASLVRSDVSCRDSIYVAAEVLRPHAKDFLSVLRDAVMTPQFTQSDLDYEKQSIMYEHEELMEKPDKFVMEQVMAAAFPCPLGNPAVPPPEAVREISLDKLEAFRQRYVMGPNVVVAATGMEFAELVKTSESLFGGLSSTRQPRTLPLVYRPGDCRLEEDAEWKARQPAGTEETTRIVIGFVAPPVTSHEFYAVSVLMALMGGGSSFSSGGPGKGMYSRLYTRALNRWQFCQEIKAFLFPFEDVSLFGVSSKADPPSSVSMVEVVVSELLLATHDISEEEFVRGRNKLKSDMFMDLESRIVQIDDVIRQVLLWNKRVTAAEHAQKIDAVTRQDVMRAARQILQGPPIVLAHGPKTSIDAVAGSKRIHAHLLKLLKQAVLP